MLRGRIMSAQRRQAPRTSRPQPNAAWVLQSDRGITYAADVPARLARGRGRMVGRRTTRARRWSRSRRRSPTASASRSAIRSSSTCSAATSTARIANLRARRLGVPRHQFRAGVLAQRLRRRAAHRHRHADLSRRRHASREEIALLKAVSDAFPAVTTVRVKDALEAVGEHRAQSRARGARRQRGRADRRGAGARRRARGRPRIASTTRWCSRRSAPRAAS